MDTTSTSSGRKWAFKRRRAACLAALLPVLLSLLLPAHPLAATPTATPIPDEPVPGERATVTLADWDYDEKTLFSPSDGVQYALRLPPNWVVETGSYLDLEYSYSYVALEADAPAHSYFGELQVFLDDQLLVSHSLDGVHVEHARLHVPLPPEVFNDDPGGRHDFEVGLDAALLCNVPHKGTLVIHPESALELRYRRVPLTLDLGDYPHPLSQRTFRPDVAYFVLPSRPTEAEVEAAAVIAARLGELAAGMVVSATTDAEVLTALQAGRVISEHLIVIGQPTTNRLTRWLEERAAPPAVSRPARLGLSLRGPATVTPGSDYGFTVTVTNTTAGPVGGLTLAVTPPDYAAMVGCAPTCVGNGGNGVRWRLDTLPPGEAAVFHLTARFTATVPPSLTLPLDSVAVLRDSAGEPVSVVALASDPVPSSAYVTGGERAASCDVGTRFFVWDGRPVPPSDGLLQEMASPWNPDRVLLLVTGGSETAVRKAGMALGLIPSPSPSTMSGPVAQVPEIRPIGGDGVSPATDYTFSDLGYADKTVYGAYGQDLSYRFFIPLGWEPTEEATLRLLFGHAAALDAGASTLTVLLNGTPLAGVSLDDSNAIGGAVDVPLPPSRLKRGLRNELTVRVWMESGRESCERISRRQIWLTVYGESAIHLAHRVQGVQRLDLRYFPYPFDERPDLSTVLFVLPPSPGRAVVESLLRLAASLGDAVESSGDVPRVSLGGDLDPATLSRYHLILVGRPASHPLVQEINHLLPQPFIPGSDRVEQRVGEVFLRLPEGVSLGYLQEMPSPWNEERALLLVAGTTDEGVDWAAAALERAWKLRGNLAVVRAGGTEIRSVDTRGLTESGQAEAVATAVPELSPVVTATLTATPTEGTPQPTPVISSRPPRRELPLWVKGVVGGTLLVVAAIIGGAAYRAWRKRSTA